MPRDVQAPGIKRMLMLSWLKHRSIKSREEWLNAGGPPDGPERRAMLAAFMKEVVVRYEKALERLAKND